MTEHPNSEYDLPQQRHTLPEKVIFLHCSASSARQWHSLIVELGDCFAPIAVDLFGHGNCREWRGDGPLTLEAEALAISSAIGAGATPYHLVGHSYGGGVALRFALKNYKQLRSMTLIEPSCFHLLKSAGDEAALLDEIRSVAKAINHAVLCGDYRAGMEVFLDYWSGPGSWADLPEDQKAKLIEKALLISHHFWNLIEEETPLVAYAQIKVPTLILCGTRSPKPSRAITRLLTETLPYARHRTIRGANHMSPMTHSQSVNALILEHLATNSRSDDTGGSSRGAVAPQHNTVE